MKLLNLNGEVRSYGQMLTYMLLYHVKDAPDAQQGENRRETVLLRFVAFLCEQNCTTADMYGLRL